MIYQLIGQMKKQLIQMNVWFDAAAALLEKGGILHLVPERPIEDMRGIAKGATRNGLREKTDRH